MSPKVVLVGLPGSGKSTLGKKLARQLHVPLVDTDQMISARYGGTPTGQVFTELGEPRFREVEAECVAEALATEGVVSLGGGAVVTPITRERLKGHRVVFIDITVAEALARIGTDPNRPIVTDGDPTERLKALDAYRRPLYHEVCTFHLPVQGRTAAQCTQAILEYLRAAPAHPDPTHSDPSDPVPPAPTSS